MHSFVKSDDVILTPPACCGLYDGFVGSYSGEGGSNVGDGRHHTGLATRARVVDWQLSILVQLRRVNNLEVYGGGCVEDR
jgi:hypothetical protein